MNNETNEVTPELDRPKRGRPRKVSLDDDAGLLDSMLKVQVRIAEDSKANAATRERAAGEVRELIKQRAARRDDAERSVLATENSHLQTEIVTLRAQIDELRQSALGKIDSSETTALRQELNRHKSESQSIAGLQSGMKSERDAALTVLRYMVTTLGESGCQRAAMKLLVGGSATKALLELFGVDARSWLQMNAVYQTKGQLLDVFKGRTSDRETELTAYCRLRLAVEHNILDAEQFLKDEEQRRLQERADYVAQTAFQNVERTLAR